MNSINLLGRLVKDPEIKKTSTGKKVCSFSIAVRRAFSKENASDFFNLEAWDSVAEIVGKWFKKGSQIGVNGRLQNNFYEKNGVKHYNQTVVVNTVYFIDKKENAADVDVSEWEGTPVDKDDLPF